MLCITAFWPARLPQQGHDLPKPPSQGESAAHPRAAVTEIRSHSHFVPQAAVSGCSNKCEENKTYSITSSASESSLSGTVRPSILAVSALIISSNFVDCMTGRSAGFAPLRMWPV